MPSATQKRTQLAVNQLVKQEANILQVLKAGDIVEGKLLSQKAKEAYIDLGKFGTGIVYGVEFSNASQILKELSSGASITAKIVDPDNEEGLVELSLAQASKQKVWQEMKELQERGEMLSVKVMAANTGGLLAEIKEVKAFLPVSQLTTAHYPQVDDGDRGKILEALKKLIGEELKVKIIDVNQRTNKLIISEREAVTTNVAAMLDKYKVGDIVDGIVSGVADFGAFVRFAENTEVEGLIHISELSHRLIENPKEVMKVNDAIKVKIIEMKDGRVSLSLKALQEDPWQKVESRYVVDADVIGVVTKFNPFGAFVSLDADIQGLIHVSEFGGVEEMQKQLEVGKTYAFHIAIVKPQEKRIILKLKKVDVLKP